MRNFLLIIGVININLFFVVASIFNYEYQGIENSILYGIYVIASFTIISSIIFFYFINNKKNLKKNIGIILFPVFIIFIFLCETLINTNYLSENAFRHLIFFFLWSFLGCMIGLFIRLKGEIDIFVKKFEIILLLFTISILISNVIPMILGNAVNELGGSDYQKSAYIAAFSYGLNLYYSVWANQSNRFNFFKSKVYSIFLMFTLILQAFAVFSWGGRGASVLIIIYTLISLIFKLAEIKIRKYFIYILTLPLFLISIWTIAMLLDDNEILVNGFDRAFSFIGPELSINWDGTSYRNVVYLNAINLIAESPFLGYGLFGFLDVSFYPHNFILEILLQGGLLYLFIFITVTIIFLYKLHQLVRINQNNLFVFFLLLYPVVQFMFSGTYGISTELWFCIGYVFGKPINELDKGR